MKGQSQMKYAAKLIAAVVRNAMEDFHCEYLSDEQMAELNPIIRDSIYTALYALSNHDEKEWCKEALRFWSECIPEYWEDPRLLPDAVQASRIVKKRKPKGTD